jgi:putative DNA primase/helicase
MSYEQRKSDHEIEGQGSSGKSRVDGYPHGGGGLNKTSQGSTQPGKTGGWSSIIKPMSEMEIEETEWFWDGRVPKGGLTLLGGIQGHGKTYVALGMAKAYSVGEPLPDSTVCEQGKTLIISTEDGVTNTLMPRLKAMGADLSQILAVNFDQVTDRGDVPNLVWDIKDLEHKVIVPNDIGLIICDPLVGLLDGIDDNSNSQVRQALDDLNRMVGRHGIACMGISHFNKSTGHLDPTQRFLGSTALAAVPRSLLGVAPDPENADRHYLVSLKCNLAEKPLAVAYTIGKNGIIFEADVEDVDVEELFSGPAKKGTVSTDKAKEFLLSELSERPRASTQLYFKWAKSGGSKRTLERAKEELGVKARRVGNQGEGKGAGHWEWYLDRHQEAGT